MFLKFHPTIKLFLLILASLSVVRCAGSQALLGAPSGGDSGFVGSLGGESEDGEDSSDSGGELDPNSPPDPFPAPFPEPRQDSGGGISVASSDEPSIFSTQVGEVYDPRPKEVMCDLALSLDLINSGGEHDVACPIPEDSAVVTPPYAELRHLEGDFSASYDAACFVKNTAHAYWGFDIYIPSFSFPAIPGDYLDTYPQHFELELFYLIDGIWKSVAVYPLEVDCKQSKRHFPYQDELDPNGGKH